MKKKMRKIFLNRALRILLITEGLVLIASNMLGPIYALFVQEVGGTLFDASIAWGIFAIASGITNLIIGKYVDRIKEDEMITVLGYFLMGIAFLLYIFVKSVPLFLIVQALIGFAQAIYAPAFDAEYTRHIDIQRAGSEWGAWEALRNFTTAIGAIVGGFVVVSFGFNAAFVIMSALCFSSAFYIYKLPRKLL